MSNDLPMALPSSRRSLMRFIVDRNPFFILSALCMFAGVRVILSAINAAPGDLSALLGSIVAVNVYETAVIALGLFLVVRRGQYRDGWMLLSVEALFLLDLTNLNAELFTANLRWGILVNLFCWLLAVIKVTVILRTLKIRLTTLEFAYIALQFAAIFFMAGVFKQIAKHSPQEGALSTMTLYAAWWMAGAMLVLATVSLRTPQAFQAVAHRFPSMTTVAGRLYVFLPFVSLVVHLCGANRVYALQFNSANVAPVLLGVAVLLTRWQSQFPRRFFLGIQTTLVGVAVLSSMPFVPQLYLHVGSHLISPLRLTLAGSAGVLGVIFFQSWQLMAAQIAACTLMAAGLGNSPAEMQRNSLELARLIFIQAKRLIPDTQMQWGIIAVVSSFAMLGIGALVSLRRQPSRNLLSMSQASGDMDIMSPDLPASNE